MGNRESYELTNPQKGIWNTEEYFKGTAINNICTPAVIYEKIDESLLKQAINKVVKKNDSFRIQIHLENGIPMQVIHDFAPFEIDVVHVKDENELKKIEEQEAKHKFNIIDNDLYYFKIAIFENGYGAIILTVNHIIADSWSLGLVIQNILKEYHALKNNEQAPEVDTSYVQYIKAELEYKRSKRYELDKEYWDKTFETIPEIATIPSSKKSNKNISRQAKRESFSLDVELVKNIKEYCTNHKISIYNFLMAIYSIYIGKCSNLNDFVIGTPILNRANYKEKQTMGMFVNIVPVRINMAESQRFTDFINGLGLNIISILKRQKYSYSQILEDIRKKNANIPNLYNVLISYQITKAFNKEYGNYKTEWRFSEYSANDIDIHISDINDTGELLVSYDYQVNTYELTDIKNTHERIVHMIEQVLNNDDIFISDIQIITEKEKQKIIYEFNNTETEYDKNKTIVDLFEEQVEETPDNIALVFEDKQLTYKELNEKANSLANYLRNNGIGRDDLVGIMVNRSLEMIIAIQAVLKAGGAYIPIDPTYPQDRIEYMLNASKAKILLTQKHLENKVNYENKLSIDIENEEIYSLPNTNLEKINEPEDLAYVIYTSGSTGTPKGVMIKHKNAVNLKLATEKELKFSDKDAIAAITTISFDMSILETLIPPLIGMKIVLANEEEQTNVGLFNNICSKNKVNIFQSTPSRMKIFILDDRFADSIKNATHILIGGEPFSATLFEKFRKITNAKIFNMYGPTETTVWSSGKELEDISNITIGTPLSNTQIYILNKELQPLPVGVAGELYIGGDGVCKGYLNNPELTKKSFIQNPFIPNSIIYKTGDMGMYTDNGEIICLGRSDTQVKMRGLRIELGEIEEKISQINGINACAVVKKSNKLSHEYLCAYYTSDKKINPKEIYKQLEKNLPNYMIPQYFMQIEKMPYTTSGKIDRKQLPEPQIVKTKSEVIKPRNEIDAKLVDILKDLLKLNTISIDDSFFELGGDSLSAINLCVKIQSEFKTEVFVRDILEHPTVQEISDIIERNNKTGKNEIIKSVEKAQYYETSAAQKRMYFVTKIAGNNSILYNISGGLILEGEINTPKLESCLNILINRHEALRTYFEMHNDEIVQKILEKVDFKLEVLENQNYEDTDKLFKNFVQPFDLSKAPLFRAQLIKCTNKKAILFIDMHHIISDGTSLSILTDELCKLYNGESLEDLKITYKDYAAYENKKIEEGKLKQAEEYWVQKFLEEVPVLNMPTKEARPNIQDFKGKRINTHIDEKTTEKIEQIAKQLNITPYMLMLSAYYILLSKYTAGDDIVVGSPIVARDVYETYNIIGMFVNTLALREKLEDKSTIMQFLLQVKENVLDAFKYQTYPFDELVNKLNIKRDTSRNPLFDVMFIYQNNGLKELRFNNIDAKYYVPDTNISKFDISLEVMPNKKGMDLSFEYATKLFEEEFIINMAQHYSNIINAIIENIDTKIADICMLAEDEKNKILYEFNSTETKYEKDKTIVDLFEEQVEKTPENIALVFGENSLTYKELNEKSNSLANYLREKGIGRNDLVGIMVNRSLEMIVAMLAVLKAGGAYIPIDPTYPKDRVEYMLNSSNAKILLTQKRLEDKIIFDNKIFIDLDNNSIYKYPNENLNKINDSEDLCYVIFTSGSTGKPKGVMLTHKNVSNFTNYCNDYIEYLREPENHAIVSITTISFDIFLYETIISLQKGVKVIIANENEQTAPKLLSDLMEKHNVDITQATPSVMQIFMNNIENMPSLKKLAYVTLAGEQLPLNLVKRLHELGTTIYNGYGPSETYYSTLYKMNDELVTIGKPIYNMQMYILDKNMEPMPIGVPGEIYIAGDGVGKGYLNNPELTNKSYIQNPFIPNSIMYKTGDMGMYLNTGEIICLGRVDHQVKIRGLRIELGEIEEKLSKINNIKTCVVIKQSDNSSHEFLCAYYTTAGEISSKEIRKELEKTLPSYMVPQYIMELNELPYTPNGKIDRKSLPKPQITNLKEEIKLPRNELDKKLIEIVKGLLKVDSMGIDDSFFEMGGDSLSAINLCVKIQSEFNTEVYVRDVLEHPTVQEISDIIAENSNNNKIEIISKVEKAEYYPVSSAQKRIYFACKVDGNDSILYNISGGVILNGKIDIQKLENCINILINRHEALRTYFEIKNDEIVQKILERVDFKLEVLENQNYEDMDKLFKNFVQPFDLSKAPLFRAQLVKCTNKKDILFIDMHHIISDGTSLYVLTDELCQLYNGESLEDLKITYKDYAVYENKRIKEEKLKQAEEYWVQKFSEEVPVLNMPTKDSRPAVQNFNGKKLYSKIDKETAEKIEELAKKLNITPYMLMLSAYYVMLSKYTSGDDIVVGSPIAGRDVYETRNIIGMFVNTLALREKIDERASVKDFIIQVKDNVLNAYKYQTYPFDELINRLGIKRDSSRNPLFDVMFIYQNNGYKELNFNEVQAEYYMPDTEISKFDMSLEVIPNKNGMILSFEYATKLFEEEFIINMAQHYKNIINAFIENIDTKISDISMLSEDEKNKILYGFNNTETKYEKDKTIVDSFEEQVEKTPENIAVVFGENSITYKELNEKANSLANYLREKGIGRNDLVGIMVKRSIEMIVAMLAVLKAGGAYIPIDPTYPKDRVEYMLNSSKTKTLLTQKHLEDKIIFENKIFIDLENDSIYKYPNENLNKINEPEDLSYVIFTSGSTGMPKGVMLTHKSVSNLTNYCNDYVQYLKEPINHTIVSITTISFDIFLFETLISLQKGLKLIIANENEQTTPKLLNDLMEKHNVDVTQATPSLMQIFMNNIDDIPSLKKLAYVTLAGEQLPLNLVKKLSEMGITIYNGYGPSETTVFSTLTKMDNKIITIGNPLYNTQIYILDKNMKPLPIGVPGEIYIAGDGVGKGYLYNEELTNKSYIQNPFIPNSIMYKTGDMGMYLNTGKIICLGRVDHQVKIRGLRIELGEIESLILEFPHIKKVTVVKQKVQNREFISAYFVSDKRIAINELRKYLSGLVPRYMVPSYFVPLDDLPYTPNGKIDRKALPLPNDGLNKDHEEYMPPKTDIQRQLVQIWEKVLNIKPIGINDNFFELGGDSLIAMQLNIELLKITNKITYSDLFRFPTIIEQEEKINSVDDKIMLGKIENLSDSYIEILKNCTKREKPKEWHPRGVLLTGSTGFLGVHILDEFIKNENGKIYCIIREEPGISAITKLLQKLHYYFGEKYDDLIDRRIFVVTGNITKPNFGLNEDELSKLEQSVDIVVNSAALVAHYGDYTNFYNANVKSVKYIIDFCNKYNKKLYHISTKDTSGMKLDPSYLEFKDEKKNEIIFDESTLYIGQILDNVYIRSKFEAENLVLDAMSKGLDGYILRMGNLMPRYKDGVFQENISENAFTNKLIAFMQIGVVPDYLYKEKLEFTPIDKSASAIYKLITHPTSVNRIFHISNHKYVNISKYIRLLKKEHYNIQILNDTEFKNKIKSILLDEDAKDVLNNLIYDFDENLNLQYKHDMKVKSDFTISYLKRIGFRWRKITDKYIIRLINLLKGEI